MGHVAPVVEERLRYGSVSLIGAHVQEQGDAELLHTGPHRIEVGVCERSLARRRNGVDEQPADTVTARVFDELDRHIRSVFERNVRGGHEARVATEVHQATVHRARRLHTSVHGSVVDLIERTGGEDHLVGETQTVESDHALVRIPTAERHPALAAHRHELVDRMTERGGIVGP